MPAETAMAAVVHHIETDGRREAAQQHAFHDGQPGSRCEIYEVDIEAGIGQEEENSFEVEAEIAVGGEVIVGEITVYAVFQLLMEIAGFVQEFWCVH